MRKITMGILILLLMPASGLWGQGSVTGSITGVVTDPTGAVVVGAVITVSGSALLNPKTQRSVAGGVYLVESLPPGAYHVTCAVPGFKSFVQDNLVLTAGFTATLNIALSTGEATDTVVVSASGPAVDVQSSTTPTTFDSTLLQDTPSGRDPWSTLAQTPGVTTSTFDVAGNNSFQQSSMSVHGSKTSETVYAFNGLDLNGPSGTSTGFYVDYDSFQEVQVVTDSAPPEIPIGGAYMNMITRSGSNTLHGFAAGYYLDDKTQAGITPPIFNGLPVLNAGSPFVRALDATVNAGGPILKDRWWIFGAYRQYDLKQILLSTLNTNGTHGTDVNHQTNTTLRNDIQINSKNELNLQWLWNYQNRFFRRTATYSYVDQNAAYRQIEPAYILEAQETYSPTAQLVVDSRIGYMQVVFPERYQPGVAPSTIPAVDIAKSTLQYAGLENYLNKEKVGRVASTASYFRGGWKGSHNFKAGVDVGISRNYVNYNYNQNIFEFYNTTSTTSPANTTPDYVEVQNGPTLSNSWARSLSLFLQDAWTLNRHLTFNLGARYDQSHTYLSAQCSPAVSTSVYAPLFPNRCLSQFKAAGSPLGPLTNYDNVDTYHNVVPRISVAYDPTGKGNQVIRAGFSMFTLNEGTSLADAVNPNGPSFNEYLWNGSFIPGSATPGAANSATPDYTKFAPGCPNPGCLAGGTAPAKSYVGTFGGITTYINPNLKRPYSEQFNVGYQRSILRDITVGVAYYFRTTKNEFAPININSPASDYTPVTTYTVGGVQKPILNPYTGAPLTLYTLKPSDVGRNYYEITNIPAMNNNRYDGIEVTAARRLINNWQALVGFTYGRNRGTYFGSNTAGSTEDFNDPNKAINRNNGSLDQDAPYLVRADLTYRFPLRVETTVNFQHESGFPILPTNTFNGATYGLSQGNESVKLGTNGSLRYPSVNDTNLRVSRPTSIGERVQLEPLVDLNNLFNVHPITAETTTYGSVFLKPTNFLGPFVARFGLKLTF